VIPDDAPAGEYHVAVGLYDFDTGQRLPLRALEDDKLVLMKVEIQD
jgi:hypothetical protein